MKFLHTLAYGLDMVIPIDQIKKICNKNGNNEGYAMVCAVTVDDILGIPLGHMCDEKSVNFREYISELMKIISVAPEWSTIRTCDNNGNWELEIE